MNVKSNNEYLNDDEVRDLIYSELEETMLDFEIEHEIVPTDDIDDNVDEFSSITLNGNSLEKEDTSITANPFELVERSENSKFDFRREKLNLDYEDSNEGSYVFQVDKESNKKLGGWAAGYELAKIAREEGIDLSLLSEKEYAEYAASNCLKLDDAQLMVHPSLRNCISVLEVLSTSKKLNS